MHPFVLRILDIKVKGFYYVIDMDINVYAMSGVRTPKFTHVGKL